MTSIQERAVRLAERVRHRELDPATLSDADWHLLLLAAGLNNQQSLPPIVCRRVLDHAGRQVGFFSPADADAHAVNAATGGAAAAVRWAPAHN